MTNIDWPLIIGFIGSIIVAIITSEPGRRAWRASNSKTTAEAGQINTETALKLVAELKSQVKDTEAKLAGLECRMDKLIEAYDKLLTGSRKNYYQLIRGNMLPEYTPPERREEI
jgi:hypothetical protein